MHVHVDLQIFFQGDVIDINQAAVQNVKYDAAMAAARNLKLWLPDVSEHCSWSHLQWPQPIPDLPMGHC